MKYIPLSVPNLKGNEKQYVLDAIEKEWVSTGGSYIQELESQMAQYLGVPGTVACQSGTSGLHLALLLSGVNRGDEVIVPTLTFIAAVNPVKYIGAYPVFMDCNEKLALDVQKLEHFIEEQCEYKNDILINKLTGNKIKAITIVHVFGNNGDMEALMKLASQYNLKVIEDATEALGSYYIEGKYAGRHLGTIGDFGVYSFNGNKIITTGGGGLLVAKDKSLLEKARYLSTQAKDDPLFYQHDEVGYNYRMTNLQAAMGVAQLEQLEDFIGIKKRNYECYKELFEDSALLELLPFSSQIRPNYWFYALIIKKEQVDLREIIENLHQRGIQTRPIWGLIHHQKPYKEAQNYDIDKALYYDTHVLNIPCSSNLELDEVRYVATVLKEMIAE